MSCESRVSLPAFVIYDLEDILNLGMPLLSSLTEPFNRPPVILLHPLAFMIINNP